MTTETLLETKRTTPSKLDFAIALLKIWPEATIFNCGILWAHFAGETLDGQYCWNWNLGNVKHVRGDGFDYVSLRGVWEGFQLLDLDGDGDIDDVDKVMLIERLVRSGMWVRDDNKDHAVAVGPRKISMIATMGNPATWFRAYESLNTGMHFLLQMKRNPASRYASAWPFIVSGDPEGYAKALGEKGYYTASQEVYAKSMRKKFDIWLNDSAYNDAVFELRELVKSDTDRPVVIEGGTVHTLNYSGFVEEDENT